MASYTFTAESSNTSTGFLDIIEAEAIIDAPSGQPHQGPLSCFFWVNGDHASDTITLQVALCKKSDDSVLFATTATCTPTTRRTAADNSSGKYVCSVAFTDSNNRFLDLATATPTGAIPAEYVWRFGLTAINSHTSIDVTWATLRAA